MTDLRPAVSEEELSADMEHYYSLNSSAAKQLESYDDTMYLFTDIQGMSVIMSVGFGKILYLCLMSTYNGL